MLPLKDSCIFGDNGGFAVGLALVPIIPNLLKYAILAGPDATNVCGFYYKKIKNTRYELFLII